MALVRGPSRMLGVPVLSLELGLSFIYTKPHKNFKEHSGTFSLFHPVPGYSTRFCDAIYSNLLESSTAFYILLSYSTTFYHIPSPSVMFRHIPSCSVTFHRVSSPFVIPSPFVTFCHLLLCSVTFCDVLLLSIMFRYLPLCSLHSSIFCRPIYSGR